METSLKKRILDLVTTFYLESHDFNGIPYGSLPATLGTADPSVRKSLGMLVKERKASVVFGDVHPNPHIRALPDHPSDVQLKKIETDQILTACVYPLPGHLESVVPASHLVDRPFTRMLALGEPQLVHLAFDLSVLEYYRNDPRYLYENDDIRGSICISDNYYESESTADPDKIVLDTFGFAYDESFNRAVAVFLRYLSDLTPEHQQVWRAKLLKGVYRLHPDYYRNTIIGDFGERISIFNAFMAELRVINAMAAAMGRPPMFRHDFADQKPRGFAFLVRPTLKEFNDFVLTLDKMISDNINKAFFEGDVPGETEQERKDGKVVVQPRGTLAMLEDWIRTYFNANTWEDINEALITLKRVRSLRQSPAHAINEDMFDQKYFHDQRQLVLDAYSAIRLLRLVLANHPHVRRADIEIEEHLKQGLIWSF